MAMLNINIPKRKKSKNELKQFKNDLRFMGQVSLFMIEYPFRVFENCVNITFETFKNNSTPP